jgi:hypothetical protein
VKTRVVRLRLFFLPSHSPDLNPDEFLNNDVKANPIRSCATGRATTAR